MPVGIVQGINSSPGISPTAITGSTNNYSPIGMVPGSTIWLDLSGAATLTGLAALPADSEVRLVNISTTAARTITLSHQSGSSTAANRFLLPSGLNWIIENGAGVTLKYNSAASRWYVVDRVGTIFPSGSLSVPGISANSIGIYENASNTGGLVANGGLYMTWAAGGINFLNARTLAGAGFGLNSPLTPSQITSNQTDYNPFSSNIHLYNNLRLTSDAARVVNSMFAGVDGQQMYIYNINTSGTSTITLLHDDGATGTAAQRFLCPANVSSVVTANDGLLVVYDGTSSRWRVVR